MEKNVVDSLFSELENALGMGEVKGEIRVNLAGVERVIIGRDAVGHLVQEWLDEWCKKHSDYLIPNPKTQSFPDYFIKDVNNSGGMLEIKSFRLENGPAFDVADFYALIETLPDEIEKLNADYLVFGYELNSKGELSFPKIWKMKIWELVGKSPQNNVTCQIRNKKKGQVLRNGEIDMQGRILKFRPYTFTSSRTNKSKFSDVGEFIDAVQTLLLHHHNTMVDYKDWATKVKSAYFDKFGAKI